MATGKSNHFLGKLFEPETDFYLMLSKHAAKSLEGLEALQTWLEGGTEEDRHKVRELEREADELKLELDRRLVASFVTPFDREDIYDLCARMDEVINGAKATVREIEALEITTDDTYLRDMGRILVEGTRCLGLAFESLRSNLKEAGEQAFLARKSENRFTKLYRQAMRDLFVQDDFKEILKRREVYSTMVLTAERIDMVGEKLLHVIVKIT